MTTFESLLQGKALNEYKAFKDGSEFYKFLFSIKKEPKGCFVKPDGNNLAVGNDLDMAKFNLFYNNYPETTVFYTEFDGVNDYKCFDEDVKEESSKMVFLCFETGTLHKGSKYTNTTKQTIQEFLINKPSDPKISVLGNRKIRPTPTEMTRYMHPKISKTVSVKKSAPVTKVVVNVKPLNVSDIKNNNNNAFDADAYTDFSTTDIDDNVTDMKLDKIAEYILTKDKQVQLCAIVFCLRAYQRNKQGRKMLGLVSSTDKTDLDTIYSNAEAALKLGGVDLSMRRLVRVSTSTIRNFFSQKQLCSYLFRKYADRKIKALAKVDITWIYPFAEYSIPVDLIDEIEVLLSCYANLDKNNKVNKEEGSSSDFHFNALKVLSVRGYTA